MYTLCLHIFQFLGPICYEAIHKPDLKSVISVPWKEFQINDEIELCLMRRERNSLFALPVDQYFAGVNEKHPSVNDKLTSYSNLVLASPGQVVNGIIARERYELVSLRSKCASVIFNLDQKFRSQNGLF